jgi:hypothetical protein
MDNVLIADNPTITPRSNLETMESQTSRPTYGSEGCSVLQFTAMPQFVIEREIPGAGSLTEDQIREVSLQSLATLRQMGPHIQWLHSYVTEDKVYCLYLAPDEETIREHARKSGIRADRVSMVRRLIDPTALKQ